METLWTLTRLEKQNIMHNFIYLFRFTPGESALSNLVNPPHFTNKKYGSRIWMLLSESREIMRKLKLILQVLKVFWLLIPCVVYYVLFVSNFGLKNNPVFPYLSLAFLKLNELFKYKSTTLNSAFLKYIAMGMKADFLPRFSWTFLITSSSSFIENPWCFYDIGYLNNFYSVQASSRAER